MKMRLGDFKSIVRNVLTESEVDPWQRAELLKQFEKLRSPLLKGQWEQIRRDYGREGQSFSQYRYATEGDCWKAEHPELGTLFLTFDSDTSYKQLGNTRLRDPGGTRYTFHAWIGFKPFSRHAPDAVNVFNTVAVGEGNREEVARQQASNKMMKLFGVDPYGYLRPKAAPIPDGQQPKQDQPVQQSPSDDASTGKQYKVYGRKGSAPAHTRHKGKVFVAGQDTKFRAGDKAHVSPDGSKLRVTSLDSSNTQTWEPEES